MGFRALSKPDVRLTAQAAAQAPDTVCDRVDRMHVGAGLASPTRDPVRSERRVLTGDTSREGDLQSDCEA